MMKKLPMQRRSLMDLIFGRQLKANAIVELHNAVVSGDLSTAQASLIEHKYEVDFTKSMVRERRSIFRELVCSVAGDGEVDDRELVRMKNTLVGLRLSSEEADDVFQDEVSRIYARQAREEICRGKGYHSEGRLEELKRKLRVDPAVARRIELESSAEAAAALVDDLIADGFASNADTRKIDELCSKLSISLGDVPAEVRDRLAEARRMRDFLVEPLKPTDVRYNLRRGEDAYVLARGEWYETRVRGSGARREVGYELIARGDLVITNRRIMVIPPQAKPKSLSWSSVLDVQKLSDNEIELIKDRGKLPIIAIRSSVSPSITKAIPIIAERCCHGNEDQNWRGGYD